MWECIEGLIVCFRSLFIFVEDSLLLSYRLPVLLSISAALMCAVSRQPSTSIPLNMISSPFLHGASFLECIS